MASQQLTATISPEQQGQRIDKIVVDLLGSGWGRARVRDLFRADAVRLNGRLAPKGHKVRDGDVVTVSACLESPAPVPNLLVELCIRLEREDIVVVRKPAGLPTAPVRLGQTHTLVSGLVARYPEMAAIGYSAREPGIVHRLDTDTSGLLLAARTETAFRELTQALRAGELDKRYLLLCLGVGLADTGVIDLPICSHPKDRRRAWVCMHPLDRVRYRPRPATTSFRVVDRAGHLALVEATAPKAARHQIRAHFAALGHPLLADSLYGGQPSEVLERQALHAHHVAWRGGAGVPSFSVTDDLPDEFRAVMELAARA